MEELSLDLDLSKKKKKKKKVGALPGVRLLRAQSVVFVLEIISNAKAGRFTHRVQLRHV